jgi:hypothetical protein
MKEMSMTPKNVGVSEELLAAMNSAAKAQGKTADELFEEAGRRMLEHEGLDALARRGQGHAQRLGRKPSDAVRFTREIRDESQRGR